MQYKGELTNQREKCVGNIGLMSQMEVQKYTSMRTAKLMRCSVVCVERMNTRFEEDQKGDPIVLALGCDHAILVPSRRGVVGRVRDRLNYDGRDVGQPGPGRIIGGVYLRLDDRRGGGLEHVAAIAIG